MTFLRLSLAAFCLVTLPHCSSESDADSGESAGGRGGGSGESSAVDRGPTTLAIEGDPNGLWWSESEQTLSVADDNGNRILRWTDEDGFSLVAELPSAAPEGAGLGQLVVLGDGTLVVTRFGYGTAGDVVSIAPSGEASIVPGLDPLRRRIGLTVDADGNLFDSWFVRVENGDRVGAVGALDLEGDERIVLEGLKKPVGVLALGDDLFVADQDLGQILKAPLPEAESFSVWATVEEPDLLAAGPDDSIFTGSAGGELYRVSAAGEPSIFESGFQQVRGVAYDAKHHRVFVADHDGDEADGTSHLLHILPVE